MIGLTKVGLERIDAAFTAHMRNERRLLDALSDDEAAALESLLRHWLSAWERRDRLVPRG